MKKSEVKSIRSIDKEYGYEYKLYLKRKRTNDNVNLKQVGRSERRQVKMKSLKVGKMFFEMKSLEVYFKGLCMLCKMALLVPVLFVSVMISALKEVLELLDKLFLSVLRKLT